MIVWQAGSKLTGLGGLQRPQRHNPCLCRHDEEADCDAGPHDGRPGAQGQDGPQHLPGLLHGG